MKIWQRIALAFFITTVILTITADGILYLKAKESLKSEIFNRLTALALSRVEHIQTYLRQNQQMLQLLSTAYIFEAVLKMSESDEKEFRDLSNETRKVLRDIMKSKPDFRTVFVISKDGSVTLSSDKVIMSAKKSSTPYFLGQKDEPYIRDAFYSEVVREGLIAISHPVADSKTEEFLGVLVATISLDELNKVTTSRPGLGKTGETYLINRDRFMISDSRFKKDTFLKEKVNFPEEKIGIRNIELKGELTGFAFSYTNYRKARVLAVYLPVPPFNWALMAEIEENEAYFPLRIIFLCYIAIIAVVPFLAILIGLALSRPITASIKKLHNGVEIVGRGDLSHRVDIDTRDEIGEFSKAFDKMTSDLKRTIITRDRLSQEIAERKKIEESLRRSQETIRRFSRMILVVQEEEKKRISRDLHDETGQIAISLGSSLSILEKELASGNIEGALEIIKNAKEILGGVMTKMKMIALDLRPPELDLLGLPVVLKEYFDECRHRHGLTISLRENLEEHKLREEILITLYRVAQEALNNIIQHAHSTEAVVTIIVDGDAVILTIRDNGMGFDVEEMMKKNDQRGLGINGIKERVELLHGTFSLTSSVGAGTEIKVVFVNARADNGY